MRRDTVALAAVLMLALFAAGAVILMPLKAHADTRLYPYTGLRYRMQDGERPAFRAELGTAFSAGRFAPALTGSLGLDGRLSPGLDVSLRYRF